MKEGAFGSLLDPRSKYSNADEYDITPSHQELITCPRCKLEQYGTVLHRFPFPSYVHECENPECKYLITESDWGLNE